MAVVCLLPGLTRLWGTPLYRVFRQDLFLMLSVFILEFLFIGGLGGMGGECKQKVEDRAEYCSDDR